MDINALRKIASEFEMLDQLAGMSGEDISAKLDDFNQKKDDIMGIVDTVNNNRDLLNPYGGYNNVFDWYHGNKDMIDRNKQFSESPIKNLFTGNYDDVRDNLNFYDKLISEDTADYKYGRPFMSEDQKNKLETYRRWRPLIALWMNLRGLFHSLMGTSKYRSMNIFGNPTIEGNQENASIPQSGRSYNVPMNYTYPQSYTAAKPGYRQPVGTYAY